MSSYPLTIREITAGLQAKKFTSVEITKHLLAKIKKEDQEINSFLHVCEEHALEQAAAADKRLAANDNITPLTGVPYGLKDYIATKGIRTTSASKILENFKPPYNSTVVTKLNDAGAVLLGKNNLDEFGMGSSTENSAYGVTKNPWDKTRVPGGSSGGSAAAVAAELVPFSIGADTGGSIRTPASFCNVTGLKPTYGRVSRFGLFALASSFDCIGPLAHTAEDTATVLSVIAGHDPHDNTTPRKGVPDYQKSLQEKIAGLKIGIPKEYFIDGLDAGVAKNIDNAISQLKKMGATTVDVSLPNTKYAIPVYYLILFAEASANLSRYDGVRFGLSLPDDPTGISELYFNTRGAGFGKEVKRRIMLGTHTLSTGFFEAYYLRAQKVRTLIRKDFEKAFANCDVIATPVTPTPPFKIGEKTGDPLTMYLADIFTVAVNPAGIPGLSIPCGFSEGLPVGLQLLAPHMQEERLLNVAHQFQQETDWHMQRPVQA